MCSTRKYPYFPTEGFGISWGCSFFTIKKFKEMYEALLEFPDGWGL